MEQKEFMAILQRYLRGEATPSEKNLIEGWYASIKQNVSDQEIPNDEQLKALYQKSIYPYVRRSTLQDNVRRFFSLVRYGHCRITPYHYLVVFHFSS